MKNFLIVLLFPLMVLFGCDKDDISPAQSENFIKYFTNYPEFTAADVAVNGQNGYAILGTAKTSSGLQICLILTDIFGNITDTATYGRPANDVARCLRKLDDGGFAILATSENPVTTVLEGYFIRTDNQGKVLWTRTLSIPGLLDVSCFEINSAGQYFIVGTVTVDDKGKQVLLKSLTTEGADLWMGFKDHGLERDDEGAHLQITGTNIVIIARARIGAIYKSEVIITNLSGILTNGFIINESSTEEEEGTFIRVLDNNNFLVLSTSRISGRTHMKMSHISPTAPNYVVWSQDYESSDQDVSHSFLYEGDKIFMLGSKSISATNSAITLISADGLGNQTDRADFGQGTGLVAVAFEKTPDGGFIIVGTNSNTEEDNTSVALIKTDSSIGF